MRPASQRVRHGRDSLLRTLSLLWELLADRNARRVIFAVTVGLVPLATLVPAALAPGLGTSGGVGGFLALLVFSAFSTGLLLLGSSAAVAAVTVRLQGLSWQEFRARTLAAAIGGLLGLAVVGGVVVPALALVFALVPLLRWPAFLVGLLAVGWLAMLSAAAADVGPVNAPRALLELWRRQVLNVSLRLAVLCLLIATVLGILVRSGVQATLAVWLAAAVVCLAPAGAGFVWQGAWRLERLPLWMGRYLAETEEGVMRSAILALRDWIFVSEQEEEPPIAKSPSRRTALAGSGRFGSDRA